MPWTSTLGSCWARRRAQLRARASREGRNLFSEAVNIWLQRFSIPSLDWFFRSASALGNEFAYLLLVTFVLWCVNRHVGRSLLLALLTSVWVSSVLKDALGIPRPSDELLRVMVYEWSSGFPSGHAQLAATVWGFLALYARSTIMTTGALLVVFMISLSRLYLGVHYLYQVCAGIIIGVAIAVFFVRRVHRATVPSQPRLRHWMYSVLLPYVAAFLVQSDDAFRIAGVAMGVLLTGVTRHVPDDSEARPSPGVVLGRLALGWPSLMLGHWLVSRRFVAPGIASMLAYCALTMWVTVGAPALFRYVGLGPAQPPSTDEEDPGKGYPIPADVPLPSKWPQPTISSAMAAALCGLLAIGISLMTLETAEHLPDRMSTVTELPRSTQFLPGLEFEQDPVVIGHQGAAGLAPGNTIAAFGQGLQAGANLLGLDVRRSMDGVLVVFAEERLDGVTEVSGAVGDMPVAELRELDAGYRFTLDGNSYPYRGRNVRIPTLEAVLLAYPSARFSVDIRDSGEDIARNLLDVLDAASARHRVIVTSEDGPTIQYFRTLAPEIPTALSREEVKRFVVMARLGVGVFYRPPARYLRIPQRLGVLQLASPALIRLAHRVGMQVHVGIADNKQAMKQLIQADADGIITSWPNHLADILVDQEKQATPETANP
jgi:glycerophosphoryl diester phosphodiesterase